MIVESAFPENMGRVVEVMKRWSDVRGKASWWIFADPPIYGMPQDIFSGHIIPIKMLYTECVAYDMSLRQINDPDAAPEEETKLLEYNPSLEKV